MGGGGQELLKNSAGVAPQQGAEALRSPSVAEASSGDFASSLSFFCRCLPFLFHSSCFIYLITIWRPSVCQFPCLYPKHNRLSQKLTYYSLKDFITESTFSEYLLYPHFQCSHLWAEPNIRPNKLGNFLKRWKYQPPDLHPEKSVCRSRSNS